MSSTLFVPLPQARAGVYGSSLKVDEAKPPPLMMACVDPEGSPCLAGPQLAPSGFQGAGLSLHLLSILAWQRCIPASPVAPALLFTLQIAKCSTLSFRGQGVAAAGHQAAWACLSYTGTCLVHTRPDPICLGFNGPPHPCKVQTRAREAAREDRGEGVWEGGAAGLWLIQLLLSPVTLSLWGLVPQFPHQ